MRGGSKKELGTWWRIGQKVNGILEKKWVFLLQNSHIQEQSKLIRGKEIAGVAAVKKHLKLQTFASEAVFPRVCH